MSTDPRDVLAPFAAPVEVAPGLTVRLLDPSEYGRLTLTPGPFFGDVLDPGDGCRVAAAELNGVIIAYWVVSVVVHLDPLFIDPAFRHHPKLALGLLGLVVSVLQTLGATYAYAIIGDADQPGNGQLAEKMGLSPVPGQLYGGQVPRGEP